MGKKTHVIYIPDTRLVVDVLFQEICNLLLRISEVDDRAASKVIGVGIGGISWLVVENGTCVSSVNF